MSYVILSGTAQSYFVESMLSLQKELVQLFNEVGNVQDVHLQPSIAKGGSYTYGLV